MTTDNQAYQALQNIFLEALELRSPEERKAYLDEACEGDGARQEAIEALLKEYEEGGDSVGTSSADGDLDRSDTAMFVPGKILAERYRIVTLLGKGGMGEVYRADDLKLEQPVALKFLPRALAQDERLLKALYNEVRLARRVTHRNVGRVYDIGEAEGLHFLSMEFIEGEDLGGLLRRIGRLPGDKAISLAQQLCAGLQAAHEEGLLHLDLKPGNLMIDQRGDLRVTDFGLARMTRDAASEKRRSGTPAYMAPEQVLEGDASQLSDIYAVGLVLYEMTTGKRLHSGRTLETIAQWHESGEAPEPPSRLVKNFDSNVERVILQCLETDPDKRPHTIVEVSNGLASGNNLSSDAEGVAFKILRTEDIEHSDVFIAYAPVDDKPLTPGRQGWISQFHRNLEVRLEQLSGDEVKVWRDTAPASKERCEEIVPHLSRVKTMVSVVSPPFVKSETCVREVDEFWRSASREQTGKYPRMLKAVKTPVLAQDLPPELAAPFAQLSGFDFYEADSETGRVREFGESFGELSKQRYFERVYDIAFEVCEALKDESGSEVGKDPLASSKTVYLAETTSDLQEVRDQLRRELLERGHLVVPDQPLPWTLDAFAAKVRDYLASADLAVHLVGNRYGLIPEDADRSVVELQNGIATEASTHANLERVIWMPWEIQATDARQAAFINRLVEDPSSHAGGEVIRDTLPNLKGLVLEKLESKPAAETHPTSVTGTATPTMVYLVCDQRDEEAIEPLEDYLFELGFEVLTTPFEGDVEEITRRHREHLSVCDGVLVYYGAASRPWVETTLMDVVRAPGYGREKPIHAQMVYVAPPEDRRKARFRTHLAEVVRQEGETFQTEIVSGFTAQLKNKGADV